MSRNDSSISPITPATLIKFLGESELLLKFIMPEWNEAMDWMPEQMPHILSLEEIKVNANWVSLEAELAPELYRVARHCWQNHHLKSFLWFCIYHINKQDSLFNFYNPLPSLEKVLADDCGMFYLLVSLSIVPQAVISYRNKGLDDSLIRDSLKEISDFCNNHRLSKNGLPGVLTGQIGHLQGYRRGTLYRLGRMEYELANAHAWGMVLRRRSDGLKILLAEKGQRFNSKGYIAHDDCSAEQSWIASIEENADNISGYPVVPEGYAVNRRMTFSLSEWEIFVRSEFPIINMHIPPGCSLTLDVCKNSFRLASDFFLRHYGVNSPKIIWCSSWIFNTQFEERIPSSNLAAFQKEVYLFPVKPNGDNGMYFIFAYRSCQNIDIKTLPRNTSLQQATLEILESGQELRLGGMFFAIEDIEKFGAQYYRSNSEMVKA